MIREFKPHDLDAVVATWEAASQVGHHFLSEDFFRRERHNIPNRYLPAAETWVWDIRGQAVGFISLLGNEVGALFVDPRFHHAGIGRALMDHAVALREVLEVDVFEANTTGRAFYERYGFKPMDTKVHAQTGLRLLRLRLPAT